MKNRKFLKFTLVLAALFLLWISRQSLAAALTWISDLDAVTNSIRSFGIWGPAVLFVLFVLQVFFAFIPGQALMVASGYLYGFSGGIFITWISLVVGGQAAFMLARGYGRPFAERWISSSTLARWDRSAAGQGIGFFATSLVLPIFPNDAMCYVAGLGKISSHSFLIANILGRGMASLITVFLGAYGSQIPASVWVMAGTITILGVAIWQIAKHRSANHTWKGDRHICS